MCHVTVPRIALEIDVTATDGKRTEVNIVNYVIFDESVLGEANDAVLRHILDLQTIDRDVG
jgi:hypothetical protein